MENINLIENENQNYMGIKKEVGKIKGLPVKEYLKNYYEVHKENYVKNRERYNERHYGSYIYFHISESADILYIGKTHQMGYRQSSHLTNDSNIGLSIEEYQKVHNFSIITYKDFTKYDLNNEDLKFLERFFKDNCLEIRKGNNVHYKEELLSRTPEFLMDIANREEMVLYPIDKYLD